MALALTRRATLAAAGSLLGGLGRTAASAPSARREVAPAGGLPASPGRPAAGAPLALREIAPGLFVHQGVHELASPGNLGTIANLGCVVGAQAAAVIDTGGSASGGQALRAAIRAVTDRPIRYVIASHVHPDHLLGHAAFLDDAPTFVGHARLPAALAARGAYYLDNLQGELGAAAAGTTIGPPTLLVEDELELDLGGRRLTLRAQPTAHTDNDLSVHDHASGTLWLADLLFLERVPVIDGSLLGWLVLLDRLRAQSAARVVPGHGPASAAWPDALAPLERYLARLRDETRALLAAGGTLEQATERVGWAERAHWRLFDRYHRRNVTAAFTELEWE
jgi:quinoprotein relay system zinc metallohydrolase 2